MAEVDQNARREVMAHLRAQPEAELPREVAARVAAVDARNLARLKAIVAAHGWPDARRFGESAAQAAWLIAEHADSDPKFQAEVLALMKPLFEDGQVSREHYALLTDRILVAEGKPQLYGTQYRTETVGGIVHFGPSTPIAEPEGLDERRAEMGMTPHAEYVERLRGMLGVPRGAPALPSATASSNAE